MKLPAFARLLSLGFTAFLAACGVGPGQVGPSILDFSPTSGVVGTVVTLHGCGFSATASADRVLFNGIEAAISSASTSQLTVTVPAGATTGKLQVLVAGRTANSTKDFTVTTASADGPTITGFTPASGPVGTQVTISGTRFASTTGGNTVELSGLAAVVSAASATALTATVPSGAATGPITVTVGGHTAASATDFVVTDGAGGPTIATLAPASGPVGTTLVISGSGFSSAAIVMLNGAAATVTAASATSLTVTVPSGATTGRVTVTVGGKTATSATDFTVSESGAPTIVSFTPTSGPVGTLVTITGTNFSSTAANDTVKVNGTTATVTSASSTSLTITVPSGASTGRITVTVAGKTAASSSDFTVGAASASPSIASFTPTSGAVGSSVTLYGANFATQASGDAVPFNGTPASVSAATSTSLTVTVPAGATTGRLTVTVEGKTATSATDFTVTSSSTSGTLYVSPTGAASAPGTETQPMDLPTALTKVAQGGTIIMKAGTYAFSTQLTIEAANSGQSGALKNLVAAAGARPVLDFSSQPYGNTASVSNPRGLQLNGSWWHVKGLEVKGAADNGIYVAGSHDIIEGCVLHANRDSGLQLGRATSSTARADWPSYNLILNCESYDNYDSPPNAGENADGFACKLTTGPGNVFRGCISHNNIDDGWDLYTKTDTGAIDPVVIDQCVSFHNGTLTNGTTNPNGDRNGFKLGGEKIAVSHLVTRSIAAANGKNGFTFNSNPGAIRLVNNLAWDNVEGNFKFDGPGVSLAIFVNNLSLWVGASSMVSDRAGASGGTVIANNGFWDKSKKSLWGFAGTGTFSAADLQSTSLPSSFPLARNADGSFALGTLGQLTSSSKLINLGVVPSLPSEAGVPGLPFDPATAYVGAPDPGAIEHP